VEPGWILAAIVLAGVALRFAALGHQSFFYDEAVSARLAQEPLVDLLLGRARDRGNPPLHLVLLHLWMSVFGSGDGAVRAFSAAVGSAAIPLVHSVARRLAGPRVALAAAALFAISPFHVYFAQEARTFALATLLALISTWFLLRAVDDPGDRGAWVGFGAMAFLLMYAHYFDAFFVLSQVAWLLVTRWRERRVLARAAAALVAAGAVYAVVWLPVLWAQATMKGNLARGADSWYLHLASTPLVFAVGTTLLWKDTVTVLRVAAAALAVVAFGGAALAGLWALRRDRDALAALLAWLLVPLGLAVLVSVAVAPLFQVRYAAYAAPAYAILAGAGLFHLSPRLRAAAAAAIVAMSALSLASYYGTLVKHDWRAVAAWLTPRLQPGDAVAFDADIGEVAYARYAGPDVHRIRLLEPPDGSPELRYWGTSPAKEAARPVAADLRAARRVWFVFSDPKSGAGDHYRLLFAREWQKVEGAPRFRGVDVGAYVLPEATR
jgi:4-amino-4-deoxy-L-arabinose transferase-like glycosyltransferase